MLATVLLSLKCLPVKEIAAEYPHVSYPQVILWRKDLIADLNREMIIYCIENLLLIFTGSIKFHILIFFSYKFWIHVNFYLIDGLLMVYLSNFYLSGFFVERRWTLNKYCVICINIVLRTFMQKLMNFRY